MIFYFPVVDSHRLARGLAILIAYNGVDHNFCLLNSQGSPIVERSTRDPFAIYGFMWPEQPS